MSADDPAPGARVGSYALERRLGAGALGEVWLGRHVVSGGLGAVKLARRDARPSLAPQRLLGREAAAVARLRHPHIVAVFEFGEAHLVYQYVDGTDLARRLHSPVDPAAALRLARQLASALAHAHANGVVHRDVKPANVLVDRAGNAWLADFGLAIVDAWLGAALRAGTPAYAAPEQWTGAPVGPAADQYALARTLCEMLVGGPVPEARGDALAALPSTLPPALRRALEVALAPDPAARHPSVEAFDAALAAVDLAGFPRPVRLAPTLRGQGPFGWCARPEAEAEVAPGVARADYRLAALAARGAVRAEVAAAFAEATALADLGFSLYASRDRLGAPSDPACLARAVDLVVLLPGWGATRAVWRDVAAAVCRDNARAAVVALDLWGVGASTYRAAPSRAQADAAAVVAAALRCLGALGLATVPAVVVGHSLSATALLSLGDAALGEGRTAVAVSPVFPAHCERYRARVRTGVRLMATVGRLPGGRDWLLRALARDAPSVRDVTPAARAAMFDNLRVIPAAALARTLDALAGTAPFDGAPRRRAQLVLGESDPLVTAEALAAAQRDLGLLPSQVTRLATGGHYPHLESATHPEWTARNLAEIGHVITRMTLAAGEVSAASAEAFSSTVVDARSPDAWGSAETLCASGR